jgi:PAS domain S-box-containing protein
MKAKQTADLSRQTAYKKFGEGLRELGLPFQSLVQSIDGIVWEVDLATSQFTYVSPQAERILGYPLEHWKELRFWEDHIHPDDQDYAITYCQEKSREGKSHDFEYRMIAADGRIVWIHDRVTVVMQDHEPVLLRGLMVDITEQKNIEARVKLNELRFRSLVQDGGDLIAILDPNANYLYVSPTSLTILGTPPEEYIGQNAFAFIHPEDKEKVMAQFSKLTTTRRIEIEPFRIIHKDKTWHWIETVVTNLSDDPAVGGIVANSRDITAKKEAELKLQRSELRFKKLVQEGSDLISVLDENGNYLYATPNSLVFQNIELDNYIGRNVDEFIHPDDLPKMREQFEKLKTARRVKTTPFRFKSQDGWRWIESIGTNLLDDPAVGGIVINSRDVTEALYYQQLGSLEKEVLELSSRENVSLKEIFEKYARGVEYIHPGIICSVQEVRNGRIYNLASPSLPPAYLAAIEGLTIGDNRGSCGTAAFRKEPVIVSDIANDIRWRDFRDLAAQYNLAACRSYPILDSSGNVLATFANYFRVPKEPQPLEEKTIQRAVHIMQLVLESYLRKQSLKQSNERYELATRATNDAIWDWDIRHNTIYWGDSLRKLFGYDAVSGNSTLDSWAAHIHPDDIQETEESLMKAIRDPNEMAWQKEYRYMKSDGTYAFVIDRGYIIRDEKGEAFRMVGAMTDYTQRKQHEEALQKLNKQLTLSNEELERFAYVASHDLQEPLRMISSFITLLDKHLGDKLDEKGKRYIHFVVDGANRMRQIILDLLEFSRAGRTECKKEKVNLNDLIKEIRHIYARRIQEKNATLVANDLPTLMAPRTLLLQVFQNLISNALKYTKPDEAPIVTISAEELPEYWKFSVADNGIGINPEYFDKIFTLFQRLHTHKEYSGTGIGLSIAKKVVENEGGRIWIESEEGKGSTFFFTWPKT